MHIMPKTGSLDNKKNTETQPKMVSTDPCRIPTSSGRSRPHQISRMWLRCRELPVRVGFPDVRFPGALTISLTNCSNLYGQKLHRILILFSDIVTMQYACISNSQCMVVHKCLLVLHGDPICSLSL